MLTFRPRLALPADLNDRIATVYTSLAIVHVVHVRVQSLIAFLAANSWQKLFLVTNSKFMSLYMVTFPLNTSGITSMGTHVISIPTMWL